MTSIKSYLVSAIMALVFHTGDTLWATPNHPFWYKDHYVEAKTLHTGDRLTALDGATEVIANIFKKDTTLKVYNFTVEDNHNYYVGNSGLLVHNDCFLDRIKNSPGLVAAIDELSSGLKGKFIEDFFEAGDDVLEVLKREPGCVKAWEILYKAGYSTMRKNPASLEKLSTLLLNPKLPNAQITENLIERAINGNRMAGPTAAALDDLTVGLNNLINSDTKFINFERFVVDLEKGGSFSEGAGWMQKYIVKNPSEFAGKTLEFEVGVISGRIDLKIGSNLFEFKSVSSLPPERFVKQIERDLPNVNSLDQMKWYFDGKKLSGGEISQTDMEAMLLSLENMELSTETINKFVQDGTVRDIVDMIESKFAIIFQAK